MSSRSDGCPPPIRPNASVRTTPYALLEAHEEAAALAEVLASRDEPHGDAVSEPLGVDEGRNGNEEVEQAVRVIKGDVAKIK